MSDWRGWLRLVALLLLVLEGGVAATPAAVFVSRGPHLVVASAEENCGPDRRETSGAPEQNRHPCGHCCIVCRSDGCVATPFSERGEDVDRPSLAGETAGRPSRQNVRGAPVGWETSWSSRAPPEFF